MGDNDTLKALVTRLDVIKTWFAPGSSRHSTVSALADDLAAHAGGRAEAQPGDPNLPTPGPGVRGAHVATEVESVGQIADAPVDPAEQRRAAAKATADSAQGNTAS